MVVVITVASLTKAPRSYDFLVFAIFTFTGFWHASSGTQPAVVGAVGPERSEQQASATRVGIRHLFQ